MDEKQLSNELLYETRLHVSGPYSPNYPPQQPGDFSKGRGLLSLIPSRGLTELKEKWSNFRQPVRLKKLASLYVSPNGERVAVAVGNRVTILRKEDDYQEPYGIFTSGSSSSYTCGAWSESHDVLGLADSSDTLYFLKANGEEILRIERSHLKVLFPIVGLLVLDDAERSPSFLCSFNFLASDGSIHRIEINPDLHASLSSIRSWNGMKGQFSQNVFCIDYNPDHSLLVLLGGSRIQLCHWSKQSELKSLTSRAFEGLIIKPKGYGGTLTYPKVLISPDSSYIAVLDLRGCMYVYKLDKVSHSLSVIAGGDRIKTTDVDRSNFDGEFSSDVSDFTWWSDHILSLARNGGSVVLFDVISDRKLAEDHTTCYMPVLERVAKVKSEVFLLDSTMTEDKQNSTSSLDISNVYDSEQISVEKINQLKISSMTWRLVSFSERSVPEMYDVLLNSKNYESALDFADRHKLDKDKLLKSQWLHSGKGVTDINSYLSKIKDEAFVLNECAGQVGPTEDAVKALLAYGLRMTNCYSGFASGGDCSDQVWDFLLLRLRFLQFRDRLETFLGVNMGRFSVQEYRRFREMPVNEIAGKLAENGKIGALNLLFKRHPYSLSPFMLEIFAAIPETVPVQTYAQLLPGRSPPSSILVRDRDWVECEKMVQHIKSLPVKHESLASVRTEHIVKQMVGFHWPSVDELSVWYKARARNIDKFSGLLENSLCLVDSACRKGIHEMQQFHEDISYLQQLVYADDIDDELRFSGSLEEWESLSDYEKFSAMLKGVKEDTVVGRLRAKAIPFMQKRFHDATTSFLFRWLKDLAVQNNIEVCLVVIEEGCRVSQSGFFADEIEAINCALQCLYSCSVTDRWNTLASIVTKLPRTHSVRISSEDLERKLKLAEGHIEAGRLLALYQVPKPMSFFMDAQGDERGVKQIIRLILSKFSRQPGRSDIDWTNMWRDLQCLQEKAFPFLDLEYLLMEFCRGLLKAGRFSLARNYLKGTASVNLPAEKAENLVIQTAREYFFSASSLACSEIWKAKECLDLFPGSRLVRAEGDIIDALTDKLPSLGVHLLPMQYKQIKEPMEIMKMAITSQSGAYLNVDELIEVAKLLGLNSEEDLSAVQEAIAREAAVGGDLPLAFDLCLLLSRKGHGLIWDLCAAIARGPAIDNMDMNYRKQLLGFALSHCDDESIGELLHAWKDIDVQGQCESLMMLSGTTPEEFTVQGSSAISRPGHSTQRFMNHRESSDVNGFFEDDQQIQLRKIRTMLSEVARELPVASGISWDDLLVENGKVSSFAALQLPWLLELSRNFEFGQKCYPISIPGKQYASVRSQSVVIILSWLARYGFAPKDDLIASLAKSIMQPPVTEKEDILGCSFILNLLDAFHGVEIIEEQLRKRKDYTQICSIMNVGMTYSSLYNSNVEHIDPTKRRELLLRRFKEKISPDELDRIDKAQATFWRGWKVRLEEQKQVSDRTRALERLIPGVESGRFLSGDLDYIRNVVFSLVESLRLEKKHILKDVLELADTYGLNRVEVLLKFLASVLVSEAWTNDEITAEITEFNKEFFACASEMVETLTSVVYPEIDGCNKARLSYIYDLLSDCYLHLQDSASSQTPSASLAHFCKVLEQECAGVSFIRDLDFKKIADINGLNYQHFNQEVCDHVNDTNVEALAQMVQTLVSNYSDPASQDLLHWQDVHRYYVLASLKKLENRAKTNYHLHNAESLQCLLSELEQSYDICIKHIRVLDYSAALDIMKKFFGGITLLQLSAESVPDDMTWKECLVVLLNFWVRLVDDLQEMCLEDNTFQSLGDCLRTFLKLAMEGQVSSRQGWGTVSRYSNHSLFSSPLPESFYFCESMILSGCQLGATESVFLEVSHSLAVQKELRDVSDLYVDILDTVLHKLIHETSERSNLHNLLSSLSHFKENFETLKRVRLAIWERLSEFSHNLQLPSHVRVYVLEVMQCILGRNPNTSAGKVSDILPWEEWEECHGAENSEADTGGAVQNQSDAPNKLQITLVALRSTKLASSISPNLEISADDLHTVNSASSCFSKLCEEANGESNFNALLAILGEWEALFPSEEEKDTKEEEKEKEKDSGAAWSDDWGEDEGWESFETTEKEKAKEKEKEKDMKGLSFSLSLHPLHACWLTLFQKLLLLSQSEYLLRTIDQSLGKPSGLILNEDEARILTETALESDTFLALKLALLFPYEPIHLQCLDALELRLKQGGVPDPKDMKSNGFELLILMLFSGTVSTIISKPSYSATFSYISFLIGNYSRASQEHLLGRIQNDGQCCAVFRKLLFPCLISELVKADQQLLAGLLVGKLVHTNAALSLINVAEATLRRYLKMQLRELEVTSSDFDEEGTYENLGNCISCLRGKLMGVVESALSCLPSSK